RSTLPPAENGAMMRTGFVGYSAAKARAAVTARNTSATRRLITGTPERTLIDDYSRHAGAAVISAMLVMSTVAEEARPAQLSSKTRTPGLQRPRLPGSAYPTIGCECPCP